MTRRRELREALEVLRGARGVRVALVYHRVAVRDAPRYEVVPTIPVDLFRDHLAAIAELADVVPLRSLTSDPADESAPLRMALTFDDDYSCHAEQVLPILRELGLHGTFFLSGRALNGLGGYWFQRLEGLVRQEGLRRTAELLDLRGIREEAELPARCEGDVRRQALIEHYAPAGDPPLAAAAIRELAGAGMGIGFHTLHHPVLPGLDDHRLRDAFAQGRAVLAEAVGRPLEVFAYPHGKTDARTVACARDARYVEAWTTQPRVVRDTDDPYCRGRWEPQPAPVDDVLILLARFIRREELALHATLK